MKPRKGSVALCGEYTLGLITQDEPIEVTYQDGSRGFSYVGIHLTDVMCPIGSPWSSRNPKVLVNDIWSAAEALLKLTEPKRGY